MFNSAVFTKVANKFVRTLILALFLTIFAALGANQSAVFGQPKLGDSVYKNQKNAEDANKSKSAKRKSKTSVAKNNVTGTRTTSNTPKRSAPKTYLNVTFLSKE